MLKAWCQPVVILEGGRIFRRWNIVEGSDVIGGVPLRSYWDAGLFLFLSASWLPWGEHHMCSAMMYYAAIGPKQ
jgi:hypothetical protein